MLPLKCLLQPHNWQTRYNDDEERYVVCSRCQRPGPNPADEPNNVLAYKLILLAGSGRSV